MSKYKIFLSELNQIIESSNRDIEEIELIAVSKKKPPNIIQDIINEGQLSFGENQIQEVENKWIDLKSKNPKVKLHFVGNIQSRKVEKIFKYCDVIHSIDRIKIINLFAELEKINNQKREYFIQINTGNESQKAGVMIDHAENFIAECISNYELNIIGLMCLPPLNEDASLHFLKLKDLAKNFKLPSLSMGMSGDYDAAIKCGSTHIRIGTNIFGQRN